MPYDRYCETCGKELTHGYVVDYLKGEAYFCDDHEPEEYQQMYAEGLAWWTDWTE